MQINNIYFSKIDSSNIEEYNIYKLDVIIGYVRLKWGILKAVINDNEIYRHTFKEPFKCMFTSDSERRTYLTEIADYLV